MSDLIITWPKTRSLDSYLDECARAAREGLLINYRVGYPPTRGDLADDARVYVVHDGAIRGWQLFEGVYFRTDGEAQGVAGEFWPEGWYIVRHPEWIPIEPVVAMGFRGWRFHARHPDRPPA